MVMRWSFSIIVAGMILALLSGGCSTTPDVDPPAKLTPLETDAPPVQLLWSQSLWAKLEGHDVRFTPLLHGDKLFVADSKGQVLCLSARNGRILWKTSTHTRIASGPSLNAEINGGLLLFGTHDAEVLALRMNDGALAWRSTVSSEVVAPPLATEYGIAVRTIDDRIFMLDAGTGKRIWVHTQNVPVLTLRGTSTPLLVGEKIVVGFANGTLAAYSVRDGMLAWEARVGVLQGRSELEQMIDVDADPVLLDGVIYAISFQGRMVAVDQASGSELWSREMSAYADFVIDQDKIYITDHEGHVWALERKTGTALWKQDKLHGRGVTGPVLQGDFLVVADREGYVHWLARDDGRFVARYDLNNESGSTSISVIPVAANDIVYVRSNNGTLEALQLRKQP